MIQLRDELWIHDDVMSLLGVPLRIRMTVVRLSTGGLWVHSPTRLMPELKKEIDGLGIIECLVAPNNGHHLWLDEWHRAFPEAALYLSEGVPKKIKAQNGHKLDGACANQWQKDIAMITLEGAPFFSESVFFHKSSRSLIVTDLIQHYGSERPPGLAGFVTRWLLEPMGFKGICVAPPLNRSFIIQDKSAFSTAIERVKKWEFERIVVAHGDIIENDAQAVFAQLCDRFLLNRSES